MSLEKFINDRIERAMAEGEFKNLAGEGNPLDLSWYFELPEDLRLTYSVLRNAKMLPDEVSLLKAIEELTHRLHSSSDENERARLREEINNKRLSFRLSVERMSRRRQAR